MRFVWWVVKWVFIGCIIVWYLGKKREYNFGCYYLLFIVLMNDWIFIEMFELYDCIFLCFLLCV